MKQHRGHVGVSSEVGRGTTFRVYSPRVDEYPETIADAEFMGNQPLGKETVLVVEDEEIVRDLATEVLDTSVIPRCLHTIRTHALAISRTYEGPIHLLLTDVVLPEMDGRSSSQSAFRVRDPK